MGIRISKFLKQTLVMWEKDGSAPAGQSRFKAPVEVACRFEKVMEQRELPDRRTVTTNCYAMTSVEIPIGSLIMEGTLGGWRAMETYPAIPTKRQGAYEVVEVHHTPSLKGQQLLWEHYA